uniref:PE-PPE domain-containing protein n=1 Tax=Gordonia phage Petito TaxID=3158876 RepID=A0AAU8GT30_9CAUD
MKTTLATAAVASMAVPMLLGSIANGATIEDLIDEGVVTEVTKTENDRDVLGVEDAIMILNNGTGGNEGEIWAESWVGNRKSYLVNYDQSFWPAVPTENPNAPWLARKVGLFAPTYITSKLGAIDNNLALAKAIKESGDTEGKTYIWVGFSQGADTLGDSIEQGYALGYFDHDGSFKAIIVSDPGSPWSIKGWAKDDTGIAGDIVTTLLGIDNNGSRDPAKTGNLDITQIVVVGDSVANFQWENNRPLSSLIVGLSGWATLHGGPNPWSSNNLDLRTAENTAGLDAPVYFYSVEGNTTYQILDAPHPTAILQAQIERDLGLVRDKNGDGSNEDEFVARVMKLDPKYQTWYEIEKPSVENAHVDVYSDPARPVTTLPEGNYEVTVPAEVATGQQTAVVEVESEPVVEETATDPEPEVVTEEEPATESESVETESESETATDESSYSDTETTSDTESTTEDSSSDSDTESASGSTED